MSTRSYIGVKLPKGGIAAVYCHADSYNNLEILTKNYNRFDLAMELIDLGNMSSLGPTLSDCKFYARDRGESQEENDARLYDCEGHFLLACIEDYTFLFDGNEWRWRAWSKPLSEKTIKNENQTVPC